MKSVLFCFGLCLISFISLSQDKVDQPQDKAINESKRYVTVKLIDGSKMVGVFDRLTSDSIFFQHEVLGYQALPLTGVESFEFGKKTDEPVFVKAETESFYREYGFEKIYHSRYSFISHGFNPKKGEAYFKSTWFLNNSLEYGFTDHFSMKFGLLYILPSLSAKFSVDLNEYTKVGVKGGFLFLPTTLTSPDASGRQDMAALFGDVGISFGSVEKNVSLGVGVIGYNGFSVPYFSLGAHKDLNSSLAVSFEMPYLGQGIRGNDSDLFLPMLMPQLFSKRSIWGIGLMLPLQYSRAANEWGETIPIPMLSYSFRAGPVGPKF